MADEIVLPPLPEPVAWIYEKEHLSFWTKVRQVAEHRQKTDGFTFDPVYTADQMHAHAAAVSAADNAALQGELESMQEYIGQQLAKGYKLTERIKVLEDALRGLVGAADDDSAERWESALDAARAALGEP